MTRQLQFGKNLKRQIESIFPNIEDVVLYINSACNLRCRHCYIGNALLSENNTFKTDNLCNFIEEFNHLSRITILGGEPLMHRGINQILESALRCDISERRLTTNLTGFFFLKPENIRGADITFAVSLDGYDAALHDDIRGAGSFEKTVSNLKILAKDGFDIEISHTVTSRNIDHFDRLVGLCKTLGITKLNLHKMSLQGNGLENPELFVSPSQWVAFCRQLQKSAIDEPDPAHTLRVRYPPTYTTAEEFDRLIKSGEYWGHRQRSYYAEGQGQRVVLYPNGRVYISSELFGTDSHVGTIENGIFRRNNSARSEISATYADDDPQLLSRLGATNQSNDEYPAILSVSFKKLAYV